MVRPSLRFEPSASSRRTASSRRDEGEPASPAPVHPSPAAQLPALQRSAGNAAVARLLDGGQQQLPIQRLLITSDELQSVDEAGLPRSDRRLLGRYGPRWPRYRMSIRYRAVIAALEEYHRYAAKPVGDKPGKLIYALQKLSNAIEEYLEAHKGKHEPRVASLERLRDELPLERARVRHLAAYAARDPGAVFGSTWADALEAGENPDSDLYHGPPPAAWENADELSSSLSDERSASFTPRSESTTSSASLPDLPQGDPTSWDPAWLDETGLSPAELEWDQEISPVPPTSTSTRGFLRAGPSAGRAKVKERLRW